jgi:hypothetical protein
MPESTRPLCAVCSDPVEPDAAHWLHEPDCGKTHGCDCDRVAHPDCCPDLECQDITNGHTIKLTARFSVPFWFPVDQINALADELCEFIAQNGRPNLDGLIRDAESTYESYEVPYVCAAQVNTAVNGGEGEGDSFTTPLVVWGHGDLCRACHHIVDDHDPETYGCLVDSCGCPCWLPYGGPVEIEETRS